MEILLTAPPNVAEYAAKNPGRYPGISGIYSDPEGRKLGSGGGTVNVLWQHYGNSEIAKKYNRNSYIINRKSFCRQDMPCMSQAKSNAGL